MLTMDTTSFAGKKALVRVDLNVPQDANGRVTDDSRARAIVRTVNKILKRWRQRHPHEPLGPSERQGEPGDEPEARRRTPGRSARQAGALRHGLRGPDAKAKAAG
jgi:hypothetical protein